MMSVAHIGTLINRSNQVYTAGQKQDSFSLRPG